MALSKVLEEIKKLKVFAEEDVDGGSTETLVGRRGRKSRAIEKLKELKEEYSRDLLNGATFIVVSGSDRDSFTGTAVEEFSCFAADPEDFYNDLSGRVSPSLYLGKEGMANTFDVLGRYLEDKMLELNIIGYPQLIFKQQYRKTLKTKEDFSSLVKQAINEQVGSEIVGVQAVRSLVDLAIEKSYSAKFTPVILNTGDEDLAKSLLNDLTRLTSRVFLVVAGEPSNTLKNTDSGLIVEKVTKDAVKKTLTRISKTIKA
jgi:hypothetical protein